MLRNSSLFGALVLTLAAVGACQSVPFAGLHDSGGSLRAFAADVRRLNAEGATKAIRGACASACTIYLGVKNVCVEPNAQLWFHAAHLPGDAHPDPLGSLEMLSYYPPRVREWVIRTQALESVDFDDTKKLTGEQLVLMGVPPCSRDSDSDAAPSENARRSPSRSNPVD